MEYIFDGYARDYLFELMLIYNQGVLWCNLGVIYHTEHKNIQKTWNMTCLPMSGGFLDFGQVFNDAVLDPRSHDIKFNKK